MIWLPFSEAGGSWRRLSAPTSVLQAGSARATSCQSLDTSVDGDSITLTGQPVPVFDHLRSKRGFIFSSSSNGISCILVCACCLLPFLCELFISSEAKEEILSSQNGVHFLEKLSKFASFLSARSHSMLIWRCKVLVQGEKRDLSTSALPEDQEVKFPGAKGEIFTAESDEQLHSILYARDRRSHSIFFKHPREGCLMGVSFPNREVYWG